MIQEDIDFVKKTLPEHYKIAESKHKGSIHCVSLTGICKGIDSEDEEHWGYIMQAFRKYFGNRFLSVDHNTCFCHVDFTIHLRKEETMYLNKASVKFIKEEDDPLCLRISAGGKDGEFYCVYRGDINQIKELLMVLNNAAQKL